MKTLLLFLLLGLSCFQYTKAQTCTATITPLGSTEFCPPGSVTLQANANEVGWTRKADFPGEGTGTARGFSLLNKGYVVMGTDFWEFDPVANSWTQKADFGGEARYWGVGFGVDGKGYFGTGMVSGGELLKDIWEYDPVANAWSRKADFPGTARRNASVFTIGSRAFLACGWDGTYKNDLWEYDTMLDQWIQKQDFPGSARTSGAAFGIGAMGYLGTGESLSGGITVRNKDFWQYDPLLDQWTRKADFGEWQGEDNIGFSILNKGYIGTGTYEPIYHFSAYDPPTDTWAKIPDLVGVRYLDFGFSIGDKGFVGLGRDNVTSFNHFYEFKPAYTSTFLWSTGETTPTIVATQSGSYTVSVTDAQGCTATSAPIVVSANVLPIPLIAASDSTRFCEGEQVVLVANTGSDTWIQKSDLAGAARSNAISFTIGNIGYLGLGGLSEDLWAYDPVSDTWTQQANFPGGPREAPVAFSTGGKGYIGTGRQISPSKYMNDLWEFDPAANTWSKKGDFAGAGRYRAVAFSIDNKGYITGGVDATYVNTSNIYFNDLWEYQPSTDQWLQKANLGTTGRTGAVAFSLSGKGYVGMGFKINDQNVTTPLTDFWEYTPGTNSWMRKADFKGANVQGYGSFSIGYKGYTSTFEYPKSNLWQYDAAYDAWTLKKAFPGPSRVGASGFSIAGKGYFGTGRDYLEFKDFWEYKPEDDFTYLWSTGATTPSIIVKTSGNYSVAVTNAQGCSATSAATGVTVGSLFPEPLLVADGPTTFCEGQSVILSVNKFWENDPLGSDSADYTYQWSTGETTASITANMAGSYWVRVTSPTGCTQVTDTVEVKTAPSLTPPYIDGGGVTRVCEGKTVPITAIPGSDDPGISFLWSTGETTQTINVDRGGHTVTTIDQNGCTATSEPFELWIEPLPTLTWDYLQPDCSGEDNGYITIIPNGYTWNFLYTFDDWATLSGSTQTNLGPGTYYLAVESETGCRSATYPLTLIRVNRGVPQITCPPPLVLAANDGCNAVNVVLGEPTTSVSCEPIIITSSHPGTTFPVGTTIVTWTATDSYGSSTCEQTVTVTDQTPPTIACPADILVEAASAGGRIVDFALPVAGDNCTSVSVTQVEGPPSGSQFPVGVTEISFSATDLAQNTVTCSFNITVTEKVCEALKITTIQVSNASCAGANTGSIIINASGGNGPYHYSIDKGETYSPDNSFYGLSAGTYHAVVESDGCVTAIHDVTITASESVPLQITCPAPLVLAATGDCMLVIEPGRPQTAGGCPPITVTRSYTGNNFPVGTTIITWEAKDASGQTATCEQLITVLDKTPPRITCPADIIVQPTSLSGAKVNFSNPTVTDNCSGTSLTQIAGPSSGSVFPIGITTITFRATDASGNTATCSFTVRVADPYCSGNGNNRKVYICHKGQTICVSVNALGAHLGHGDQLGQCEGSYTKPSAQPVSPGISVYPNPTKGRFTVQLNNMPASDASLLILDVTGRIIENRSVKKAGFPATMPINLKNKVPGIYLVRFISNGEAYNTRIIVE